jgi:hypothetical protein
MNTAGNSVRETVPGIGHVVSVADEELHLAILTAIKVAEEPERSLVSVTDLAEVVETRLHVSARELTAAVDVSRGQVRSW